MEPNEMRIKMNEICTSVKDLDELLISLSGQEDLFRKDPSNPEAIQSLGSHISDIYSTSLENIKTLLSAVENQMKTFATPQDDTDHIPSPEEIHNLLVAFFKGKIKTKSAPIPNYCGCYAFRRKGANAGQFICAHHNQNFTLMIVTRYVDDKCYAYDPYDPVSVACLSPQDWTPLPYILPEKPLSRWEHSKGKEVLALWKEEEWTSVFYPATVLLQPSDRAAGGDDDVRGYLLHFGDNQDQVVPEQFVAEFPEPWKKLTKYQY